MKKNYLFLVLMSVVFLLNAQNINDFTFSESAGTFNSIVGNGGTFMFGQGSSYYNLDLSGSYTFVYNGVEYSRFNISKNGALSLGNHLEPGMNNTDLSNPSSQYPIIAPLWDLGQFNYAADGAYYKIDGSELIIEWDGIYQGESSPYAKLYYQIRFDTTDMSISFVYGDLSDAASKNLSASIGINDYIDGSGYFWSITPGTSGNATASNTIGDVDITGNEIAAIASGTIYKFTPNLANADLAVVDFSPKFIQPDSTVVPTVTIFNFASETATSYTVTLSNNAGYNQTVTGTEEIPTNQSLTIEMPTWTAPSTEGWNTVFTASVSISGDSNSSNDQITDSVLVSNFVQAFVLSNGTTAKYVIPLDTVVQQLETDYNNKLYYGATFKNNVLYAIQENFDDYYKLGTVNQQTGEFNVIGNIVADDGNNLNGLIYDRIDDKFYTVNMGHPGVIAPFSLCEINPTNGILTEIATNSDPGVFLVAVESDVNGNLYAIGIPDGVSDYQAYLYSLSKTDASLTFIGKLFTGASPYWWMSDMSFAPDGTLYFHNYGNFGTRGGLFKIDTTTGKATYWGGFDAKPVMLAISKATKQVTFNVANSDMQPITGAQVLIEGETLYTDSLGKTTAYFSDGTYSYLISADCYTLQSGQVTVAGDDVVENVIMNDSAYSVAFSVSDGITPIDGVNISVMKDGNELFSGQTVDGEVVFENALECGNYSYLATHNSYLDTSGTFSVNSQAQNVNIIMVYSANLTDAESNTIILYPNPTQGNVNIRNAAERNFVVVDIAGKIVFQTFIADDVYSIDLSDLDKGFYIVKIFDSQTTLTKNLIIN